MNATVTITLTLSVNKNNCSKNTVQNTGWLGAVRQRRLKSVKL